MVQDRPSSGHKKATRRWLLSKAGDSVEGQDPLGQLHGLIVADGVRRHGNRAPVTGGAILDAVDDVISITGVLGGHFFHGRADYLVVHAVAGNAGLGGEQRLTLTACSGTAFGLATRRRRRGSCQLFSTRVACTTNGANRLDTLGNGFLGGRMGTASEQGKYCCRSSQNILRNRHLSILITAIGMRPRCSARTIRQVYCQSGIRQNCKPSQRQDAAPRPPPPASEFDHKAWT